MKWLRMATGILLAASGAVFVATPASAADCVVSVSSSAASMWVKVNASSSCSGEYRAVLYYLTSPSSPTTYSTRGSWVPAGGGTSVAYTSTNYYYAGRGYERR